MWIGLSTELGVLEGTGVDLVQGPGGPLGITAVIYLFWSHVPSARHNLATVRARLHLGLHSSHRWSLKHDLWPCRARHQPSLRAHEDLGARDFSGRLHETL